MTAVPNTNTFSLQDVYNSVHGHAAGTAGNLQSCFANAVDYYFDPAYKGDKTNLYNFRNYTPYSVVNKMVAIVLNNSADGGKTSKDIRYNFTSNGPGDWSFNGNNITLQVTQPSFFYAFTLESWSSASPKRGDVITMKISYDSSFPVQKYFNPSAGHKMRKLISQTEYTAAQLSTILSNATQLNITTSGTDYVASFDFNISLTQNNFIYLIYDYRE